MPRVVAHLIVGTKREPFLPATLASIEHAIDHAFVNENSGLGKHAPNLPALEASALFRGGRMSIARTEFSGFATARNACLGLDRAADTQTWVLFIDGDEVHAPRLEALTAELGRVPGSIAFVDGFTWHFFKSFGWYLSIERRMMLFRWSPEAHWEGDVHERLRGVRGKRLALPYVYAHYGHVSPFAEDTRRGTQYASLGQLGNALPADIAREADVQGDFRRLNLHFADRWRRLIRFTGEHPPWARPIIVYEALRLTAHFGCVEAAVTASQPPWQRVKNIFRKINYQQRWRARWFDAARYGMLRLFTTASSKTR